MFLLIIGVALWILAHSFKRYAPATRAQMGDKAKGPVALASLVAIVLMVIGFRMADGAEFWGRSPATVGINNLLTLAAVYLFAASGMKTRVTSMIRHPQLTAVILWAVAHLLVNGDVQSFILFGGMLAWALFEIAAINRQSKPVLATGPFPAGKEIGAIVGTVVVYGAIVGVHYWLGYATFG